MGKRFNLEITLEEEKVIFTFAQLSYFTRSKIAGMVTSLRQGEVYVDKALECFYNIKYALKDVEGLTDEEGKPYKLSFEKGVDELTDACVDELLSTEIEDKLLLAAGSLAGAIPKEIVHPLTGLPVEGIKILDDKEGLQKN